MILLVAVCVGLSAAFALFVLVLALELYYMWSRRRKRRQVKTRYCGSTQVKQVQWSCSTTWRNMVAVSWSVLGAEELKRWANLRLQSTIRWLPAQTGACVEKGELEAAPAKTLEDGQNQEQEAAEEEEEEEDVFSMVGLWGPPRLLFTIKEETMEEMEQELEVRSVGGAGGKGNLLFVPSACTSPFVTPPSSPPFATPCGSPALPLSLSSSSPCKHAQVESSSTSTSSSSPAQLGRRPHCEDTSSFPAALSPSAPPPSTKRQRRPLCLLLDPPPAPSSALYHYHHRVHPLTSAPPLHRQVCIYGDGLCKPTESEQPIVSSFHLTVPSQLTTPCHR